ncbi:MAG: diguanylate cyclase, partial [Solirubrobacteraceae bacterium]|nr:diguanylate cyclase [Solirubrobacteraceae bacterium]
AAARNGAGPDPGRRPSLASRVPLRPLVVAGVLLLGCWVTVNYAIGSSRSSREEARQLAIVAAQADALADMRTLIGDVESLSVLRRSGQVVADNVRTLKAALSELPDQPDIDGLRRRTETVEPLAAAALSAFEAGRRPEARSLSQTELRPVLETLRADSRRISADHLARAARVEDVARIASGLALFGGAAGLGLVGLAFSRLRQRSLVERTRAEVELHTGARLDALVSHATDAVTVLDPDGRISWISSTPAFPLARDPQEAIGRFFTDLVHPTDRRRGAQAFNELLVSPDAITTTQLRLATAQGGQRPVEVRGENRLGDPAIEGIILTIHDVSERTILEDQLERLASRDPVTGVANRAQLEAHLGNAVTRRDRRGGFAALLLVDLDDFRAVSDTLGHDAGDELLRHAARRLEQTAGEGDLVARLDGDTFAVLLDDLRSV